MVAPLQRGYHRPNLAAHQETTLNIKTYGEEDADPALKLALLEWAQGRATDLLIVFHQRRPADGKPCQKPGCLLYEFLLDNSNRAQAAWQLADGSIELPKDPT